MVSDESRAYYADIEGRDAEFWQLWNEGRENLIPVEECEPGYLYWGGGRALGELAICRAPSGKGAFGDAMMFEGLSNEFGVDCLDTEIHYDENPVLGTWCPYYKLEKVAEVNDELELMSWLVNQWINIKELRIHWLKSMPYRLRQSPSYYPMLSETKEQKESYVSLKVNGFSNAPPQTFRQIMEARRLK